MSTPEIKHHTVQANGLKMHYVEAGEGPLVLLLHGFPETWFAWCHQIPVLARQYRVVAPDLRGYGETAKPMEGYDKHNVARDIRELMNALGAPKAAIVGHDRGAFNDYRAAKEDVAQDEEDKDTLISCPTLVLWGEDFESGGKMWDFREVWTRMATRLEFVSIPQCGHLPHEEKPEEVTQALLKFLEPWRLSAR